MISTDFAATWIKTKFDDMLDSGWMKAMDCETSCSHSCITFMQRAFAIRNRSEERLAYMTVSTWPEVEVSLKSRGGAPKVLALQTLPYILVMGAQVLDPEVLMSTPAKFPLPATC